MNILVLSATASAINYIRTLTGDPEIILHLTDCNPTCPGLYAAGVVPHLVPRASQKDAYLQALDRIIAKEKIDLLIPTSDYDMAAVMELLHSGWNPPVKLFRPPRESFAILSDKRNLAKTMQSWLPDHIPQSFSLEEIDNLRTFPLVVKPRNQSGGHGVSIVRDRESLLLAVDKLRESIGDALLVQEYIDGSTHVVVMVYDAEGRQVVALPLASHLTFFTWGGGGCAGEIMSDPSLVALATRVIECAGGWCGPINLEFRRQKESGRYYLMEGNCRLNGYSYLTTMNNVPLPRAIISLLTHTPLPSLRPGHQPVPFVLGFRERVIEKWIGQS
ncbi:MAG: ATP-grasp domain-containing protein [Magnetococcales bacterium]|nr:ATP-grasp domain-containing protein [Magnetococcales bacterium]